MEVRWSKNRHSYIKYKLRNKAENLTYEDDLLKNWDAIDYIITIFLELAVSHHCVLNPISLLIVDRNDHGVVILDGLAKFKRAQLCHVEGELALGNLLIHALVDHKVSRMHIFIGRVEHLWSVIRILLFGAARVDPDVSVAKCIIFECHFKLVALSNSL